MLNNVPKKLLIKYIETIFEKVIKIESVPTCKHQLQLPMHKTFNKYSSVSENFFKKAITLLSLGNN